MLSCICFFVATWTVAGQAPLSMEFSRREYWSWLSLPTPGNLPSPGIKPASLVSPALAGGFFTTRATWEALALIYIDLYFSTHWYLLHALYFYLIPLIRVTKASWLFQKNYCIFWLDIKKSDSDYSEFSTNYSLVKSKGENT